MLLGARQFFERRGAPTPPLPYDAEVEYIESTGTQFILTGIQPVVGDVFAVDADVQYSQSVGSDTWLTGWYLGSGCSTLFGTYGSRIWFTYNVDSNAANTTAGLTDRHRIRYNAQGGIYIDDSVLSTIANNTPLTVAPNFAQAEYANVSVPIFGRIIVGNNLVRGHIKAKVFAFSVILNGTTVFDGQPVRFTNELGQSEGAMYDRRGVGGMNPDGSPRTDGLYRNRGTGAFLWTEKQ